MDKRVVAGIVAVAVVIGVVVGVLMAGDEAAEPPEVADEPPEEEPDQPDDEDDPPPPEEDDEEPTDPVPAAEVVTEDLDDPWGLAFLDDGRLLVTQAAGELSLVDPDDVGVEDLDGVPEVSDQGQGGLLDVEVHPDGDEVYLTYAAANDAGETTTHLARGGLDLEQQQLTDVEELYVAEPPLTATDHYGSRVIVGDDDMLYLTVGDRGSKDFDDHPAQDTTTALGTTIRLERDGSVPDDNPFVGDTGVLDEIFTYGHRNVQGMTVHPDTDEIWQSEHGEENGDELNVLEAGGNYGWPIAHTGCEYGTDTPIGDHPDERDDTVSPLLYFECNSGGFPPAGMAFYDGDEFPAWQGDLFVGGLATEDLRRFNVDDHDVEEAERLLEDEGWRVRDVAVGPHDGALYLAIDGDVGLVRLVDGAA